MASLWALERLILNKDSPSGTEGGKRERDEQKGQNQFPDTHGIPSFPGLFLLQQEDERTTLLP